MLVRVLKKHNNAFGDHYFKVAGDVYDHPSPGALIKAKKLEAADGGAGKVRGRQGARKSARGTAKGNRAKRAKPSAAKGG